jgi:hypothetical protein
MKSNSRIFKKIREAVISGKCPEKFRVKDVLNELGTSLPFLSKHSIDSNNPAKLAEGNAYFIRAEIGLYQINPIWLVS